MHFPRFSSARLLAIYIMSVSTLSVSAHKITGSAVDVKDQRHMRAASGDYPWLADCVSATWPEYTYEDRARHLQGTGLFRMIIDPKTGSVAQVKVIRSTGSSSLDYRAISALKKWRWIPQTWKEGDIHVTFT